MNTRLHTTPHRAFTLIEMLVVITIVGILAALVGTAATSVIRNAKKVKTKAALKDIVLGIQNYRTEYNKLPLPPGHTSEDAIPLDQGSTILKILLGGNDSKMNPREIRFIEPPMGKDGAGGLSGTEGNYSLTDSWGTPYEVMLDANYDNKILNPDSQNEDPNVSKGPREVIATAIAYSYGEDKKKGTKDDIVSWR